MEPFDGINLIQIKSVSPRCGDQRLYFYENIVLHIFNVKKNVRNCYL